MRDFHSLLRAPGVGRTIATQLAARFPAGMYTLGILMHVVQIQGSYTAAGLVVAAMSIGVAVAGPITSRLLSSVGTVKVLLTTLLLSSASFLVLAIVTLPLPGLMAVALVAGAATPPVLPAVRTLYPQLTPPHLLTALFSLDAALQEIIWVIGPVLITLLVASLGSSTALIVVVGVQLLGGVLFITLREVRQLKIPAAPQRLGKVLKNRTVLAMALVSLMLIGSLAAVEASVVATFGHGSISVGIVLAICSLGSLLGGLWAGNRVLGRWSLTRRLAVVLSGLVLAIFLGGFAGLSVALFVSGMGTAPALAAVSSIVAAGVTMSDTAEAYGWIGTGQLLGASAASAIAGIAIDNYASVGGFAVAAGIGVLSIGVAALFRNTPTTSLALPE